MTDIELDVLRQKYEVEFYQAMHDNPPEHFPDALTSLVDAARILRNSYVALRLHNRETALEQSIGPDTFISQSDLTTLDDMGVGREPNDGSGRP